MRILSTKLFFPTQRPDSVARPYLVQKLDSGLRGPLTLISAPAGSGKTSLMAEWRAGPGHGKPAAWLSLDSADNDPLRFLLSLVTALERAAPETLRPVLSLMQSLQGPPYDGGMEALLEALYTLPGDLVLVLDDYHLIANLQVHEIVNRLFAQAGENFHLAILTRADPPLPLGRLRVCNQLCEIRGADLRFNPEEVTAFLSETMHLSLKPEKIAALEEHTEGWIAGLQLAALSIQRREDAEDFVSTFTGSHHYVIDYLVDEVLNNQPEQVRNFLLNTSILDRMCASLCDALTGSTDGQAMLEALDRSNLFVIALDTERRWFRYHHLFRDMLRNRLHHSTAGDIAHLHHAAADWLEANGFLPESVNHELSTGNLERAAQFIDRHSAEMLMRGEMMTLLQWLDAVDPVLLQHASLCIIKAWALAFTNRSALMEDLLEQTERLITGDAENSLWGDLAALRSYLASVRGETGKGITYGQEALRRLPESNRIVRGVVYLSLGGAYWSEDDLEDSAAAFEQAAAIGLKVGSTHLASTALVGLANRSTMLGDLQAARAYCERALQTSRDRDNRLLPTAADACLALGNLYYEWNDLSSADQYYTEGIRLIRLLGRTSTLADGKLALARLRLAQSEPTLASALIEEAERHQQDSILHPSVRANLAAGKITWFLRTGSLEPARQVVEQRGYGQDSNFSGDRFLELLAYGDFLLACHDANRAGALARSLIDHAGNHGWMDVLIRAQVLNARACAAQGQTALAVEAVGKAVRLAEPAGYMRVFLDQGEVVRDLLSRLKTGEERQDRYIFKLLSAFGEEPAPQPQQLVEPLSEREIEILRLVALGKSNQQIADELILATGTVKKHLNNIFGKLDVKNRTECVARAREINLL